ncbi:hypothetical protein C2G38_2113974 [Gigaspora rosea]|uniref:Uncharacterized protein n=1 Tax=Gigaspora rosea TaxID=44941 RepID=A0A397UDW4_9GLOM|nr:hypothetical protein C2G38_2113974 [Gigaspora rosea]
MEPKSLMLNLILTPFAYTQYQSQIPHIYYSSTLCHGPGSWFRDKWMTCDLITASHFSPVPIPTQLNQTSLMQYSFLLIFCTHKYTSPLLILTQ